MTTEYEELSITSLPLASDVTFIELVQSFYVDPENADVTMLQRDGATAVIDLAVEFEKYFALGTHNAQTFETYWRMWHYLLQIAPVGFVAPVATLFATLAYERGDTPLAYRSLERATIDAPAYSLTILLRRVFGSGWPATAFAAMRIELHPKVTAGIFE